MNMWPRKSGGSATATASRTETVEFVGGPFHEHVDEMEDVPSFMTLGHKEECWGGKNYGGQYRYKRIQRIPNGRWIMGWRP